MKEWIKQESKEVLKEMVWIEDADEAEVACYQELADEDSFLLKSEKMSQITY